MAAGGPALCRGVSRRKGSAVTSPETNLIQFRAAEQLLAARDPRGAVDLLDNVIDEHPEHRGVRGCCAPARTSWRPGCARPSRSSSGSWSASRTTPSRTSPWPVRSSAAPGTRRHAPTSSSPPHSTPGPTSWRPPVSRASSPPPPGRRTWATDPRNAARTRTRAGQCGPGTVSAAAATASSSASRPCAATSCSPTGSPAPVRPAGRLIAGCPVMLKAQVRATLMSSPGPW